MDKDGNLTNEEKKHLERLQKRYLRRFAPKYYNSKGERISKQQWDKLNQKFKRGLS